ncbi:hypothetical protein INS49_012833 [Diaporthe citri]|uniref:uncharacterized protein n=1 Tax=Diaporthe citri TaxID=83186 RepID=UPI001C8229DB|nr:uncharacterized protein INS49_012833 [Diaporthe citri]KAG6359312.1 hypothetical protein INS49_012833 [Diaporthe citri]
MEFMIDFLCQITETEPKTAMGGTRPQYCSKNMAEQADKLSVWQQMGLIFQLYFRKRFSGGAMNKFLEVTGSGSGTARYGVRRGDAAIREGHEIRVKTSPKISRLQQFESGQAQSR